MSVAPLRLFTHFSLMGTFPLVRIHYGNPSSYTHFH